MAEYGVREYVELFHLLFLDQLGRKLDKRFYALKGGANLRFFARSLRYSEDIDLDTVARLNPREAFGDVEEYDVGPIQLLAHTVTGYRQFLPAGPRSPHQYMEPNGIYEMRGFPTEDDWYIFIAPMEFSWDAPSEAAGAAEFPPEFFGGVDSHRVSLISTDPSGSYRGHKAHAIGRNSEKAMKVLHEQYREGMNLDEATALAIESLKEAADETLTPEDLNISTISEKQKFKTLTVEEIKKYF